MKLVDENGFEYVAFLGCDDCVHFEKPIHEEPCCSCTHGNDSSDDDYFKSKED
jgi:hypothetical protein